MVDIIAPGNNSPEEKRMRTQIVLALELYFNDIVHQVLSPDQAIIKWISTFGEKYSRIYTPKKKKEKIKHELYHG